MNHTTTFRVKDMASVLGTDPRRIEGWVEQGFLKPRVLGKGPGRPHGFDYSNLLTGALLLEFQDAFGTKSPFWRRVFQALKPLLTFYPGPDRLEMLDLTQPGAPQALVIVIEHSSSGKARAEMMKPAEYPLFVERGLERASVITLVSPTAISEKVRQRLAQEGG